MSEGNRFWRQSNTFGLLANPNYATHRERGVIPGCVPAVDVMIERTPEEARSYTLFASGRYILDMRTMDFKEFINKPIERAAPVFRNL